jgi:ferritin-like metal-binding protein YciE
MDNRLLIPSAAEVTADNQNNAVPTSTHEFCDGKRFNSLPPESVKDLFLAELRELYDAENRLAETLRKMADAASCRDLKNAFTYHLGETEKQALRLDGIFKSLNLVPIRGTCEAMKDLVKRAEQLIYAEGEPEIRDAGLLGTARCFEDYEMAAYATARTLAERLGFHEVVKILETNLEKQKAADEKLTSVADTNVNPAEGRPRLSEDQELTPDARATCSASEP